MRYSIGEWTAGEIVVIKELEVSSFDAGSEVIILDNKTN